MNKNWIIYDIEIEKAIPVNGPIEPGIAYCEGWHDHAGMGISVIGVYDYLHDRYRVICDDNKIELARLINRADCVISFNGEAFDHRVLEATWQIPVPPAKSYDLLCEVWEAASLERTFNRRTHGGYGLDQLASVNIREGKTGHGAIAPVDWQRGNIGAMIDYCLQDVRLTKKLIDLVEATGQLQDPKYYTTLDVRRVCQAEGVAQ